MYLYLKNAVITASELKTDAEGKFTFLINEENSVVINNVDTFPHVRMNGAPLEYAINNGLIQKYFFRAILQIIPTLPKRREYGIYIHKNAKAEYCAVNGKEKLRIECNTLQSLKDVEELKQMFMSGVILPSISYEKKQVRARPQLRQLLKRLCR